MLTELDLAEMVWGLHPSNWPRPPRRVPRWFYPEEMRRYKQLQSVFKGIDQAAIDRYYNEVMIGQQPDEDAGGYFIRCYTALATEPSAVARVGFETGATYKDPDGFHVSPVHCLWSDESHALVRIGDSRTPQVWDQNLLSWERWEKI